MPYRDTWSSHILSELFTSQLILYYLVSPYLTYLTCLLFDSNCNPRGISCWLVRTYFRFGDCWASGVTVRFDGRNGAIIDRTKWLLQRPIDHQPHLVTFGRVHDALLSGR